MAGIATSLSRLRTLRELFEKRLRARLRKAPRRPARPSRLKELTNFGSNPGNLRMYVYVPGAIAASAPLVVALHGCTQTAETYDQGTGWSDLADRLGFIVVFPEQQAVNNPKTCFSWFLPRHTARDSGEALSIRQMIGKANADFGIDRSRIFVTGLSAGGAMTSVMLATYPEIFAGGAIIAGLPYGAASSVQEAFEAMFNERAPSSRALGELVRAASSHRGTWPKVSVWHGTADTIVRPSNAENIIRQWVNVQNLPECPSDEEQFGRHARRIWKDANGDTRLEAYSIAGMAHGVPLATTAPDACGTAGPFFLEAGLSSTSQIASFWGLYTTEVLERQSATRPTTEYSRPGLAAPSGPDIAPIRDGPPHNDGRPALDPGAVIAAAFKAAGLPRPETSGQPGSSRMIDPSGVIAAALKAAGLTRS